MTPAEQRRELERTLATLEAAAAARRYQTIRFFNPYPKQLEFFRMGRTKRERLLMAGNQLGKSHAGAYEMALHLTGLYPDNWEGRRFDHPIKAWAAGETSLMARNVSQTKLCGEPGQLASFGTGMIPKDTFKGDPSMARGVTDAYDTIWVEHRTNGIVDGVSICRFKSYEQGRAKFQGDTLDVVWLDEEPDMDIYMECLTRTNATGGMVYLTFTPLMGRSTVVMHFLDEQSEDRGVVIMTIMDVPAEHFPGGEVERQRIINSYPLWQRDARLNGVPMLGEGRVFPYSDDAVVEAPLDYIPPQWTKLWGIDFGIGHPFAAVLTAWDRDKDIFHILHTIRVSDQLPLQHASAMKKVGAAVSVAWPHDGDSREHGTGQPLMTQYKAQKLHMLGQHAQFTDGSNSTEAGIMEMQDRITTGRFKVAAHLSDWLSEFHIYHRKNGLLVKVEDDLMSATRIAVMDKRHGRTGGIGPMDRRQVQTIANDVDFDVFGG